MAHKARRRPSWKKTRSKHFPKRYDFRHKVFRQLDRILQEEIDKEILEKLKSMFPERDGNAQDCKSLRIQFDSGRELQS